MIYRLGDSSQQIKGIQRALNEILNLHLDVDGYFGVATQSAICQLQDKFGINDSDKDGIHYGENCSNVLKSIIKNKYISEIDFIQAASILDIEVNIFKKVALSIKAQNSFLDNGFPLIYFHNNIFYKTLCEKGLSKLANEISVEDPDLCSKNKYIFIGGEEEVARFNKAVKIDLDSAAMATTWGGFYCLGANYMFYGYNDIRQFIVAMESSEKNH